MYAFGDMFTFQKCLCDSLLCLMGRTGQKGGCIIVDSTRRGKRFPDSMSKTIPIWTCVLNRSISKHLNKIHGSSLEQGVSVFCSFFCLLSFGSL